MMSGDIEHLNLIRQLVARGQGLNDWAGQFLLRKFDAALAENSQQLRQLHDALAENSRLLDLVESLSACVEVPASGEAGRGGKAMTKSEAIQVERVRDLVVRGEPLKAAEGKLLLGLLDAALDRVRHQDVEIERLRVRR